MSARIINRRHRAAIPRRIGDLGDGAVELPVAERIDFQLRLLAKLDQDDVHPCLHFVQINDGHDISTGLLSRSDDAFTESETVRLSFLIKAAGPSLIATLVNGGTEFQIGWNSEAGASYQLQSRTTFNIPDWTNEGGPIVGPGGPQSITVPKTVDTLKVFQLVTLP